MAGSKAQIDLLFDLDLKQLARDQSFYNHINLYAEPNDETFVNNTELERQLSWMDQIENPKLMEALQCLTSRNLTLSVSISMSSCH